MGKFCQISTELWPLIYVKILFQDYLEHLLTYFLQTLYMYRSSYQEGEFGIENE